MHVTDGTGEKELNSGIYLVVVETASTGFYEYNFNPGLIALPDNQAFHSAGAENKWIYEVTANLKPNVLHGMEVFLYRKILITIMRQ